ncbi:hypothetical protein LWI28_019461 [Acer negundo]|uniref:Uncharacterized protein n=1 Tax=Acer negundo TaxID=4023 RepID=A0AAD5IJU5_ACENE|nr:hypothetical protein LWI28_019461 [Acer negundo]KAK4840236.1 hypothetical protein QYF36_003349 [Acer negundo]
MIPPKKTDQLEGEGEGEGEGDDYDEIIGVHLKALDDLVNVNSLFTIAVFIGMSVASPNQHSLEIRQECDAGPLFSKRLILYEIVSFACFLLSSLSAKSLKVLINLKKIKRKIKRIPKLDRFFKDVLLSEFWGRALLALSIVASFVGIVLLTMSMANVIQIKVGKLSCGSEYAQRSVITITGALNLSNTGITGALSLRGDPSTASSAYISSSLDCFT